MQPLLLLRLGRALVRMRETQVLSRAGKIFPPSTPKMPVRRLARKVVDTCGTGEESVHPDRAGKGQDFLLSGCQGKLRLGGAIKSRYRTRRRWWAPHGGDTDGVYDWEV